MRTSVADAQAQDIMLLGRDTVAVILDGFRKLEELRVL